jgi:threonine/homoserine/homoserine lactone efflux protein
MSDNAPTEQRWVLVVSIVLVLLGVTLLTLRSVLFSLALIIAGIAIFTYWLYGVVRSREVDRQLPDDRTISSKSGAGVETLCTCSICKHTESKTCIEVGCACCVLMRNKQIIGHFNKLHH